MKFWLGQKSLTRRTSPISVFVSLFVKIELPPAILSHLKLELRLQIYSGKINPESVSISTAVCRYSVDMYIEVDIILKGFILKLQSVPSER